MAANKKKILRNMQKQMNKGNWDRAIAEAEKLTQDDFGADTSLANIRGDLYLQKGDLPQAIELYEQAAAFYEDQGFVNKAIAMYRKALRLDSNRNDNYRRLARLYADQGLTKEAITQYEVLASNYEAADQVDEALKTYQLVQALEPANLSFKVRMGELLERRGNVDLAAAEYIEVAERCAQKGEVKGAQFYFKKAQSLQPQNVQALTGIASFFQTQGDTDGAVQTFERILEIKPDDLSTMFKLGKIHLKRGNPDEALPVFIRILQIDPDQESVQEIVGRLLLQKGQYERAYQFLERMIDKYLEHEQYEEAIKLLQPLDDVMPNNIRVKKRIALLFTRLNMEDRAHDVYQQIGDILVRENQHEAAFKIFEKLYTARPGNQAFRKQYFELARELGRSPMFIEPEATTAPRPVRREPARPEPRLTPAPVEPELEEAVASEPRRALSRKDRERIAEFHSEADVFIKYGLLDNAINRLESALALDPDDIKARLRLRDLFMKSNRQADAIEQLGIAAQILERTDKLDKAEKLYRDILKLDPTNATIEAKLQQLLNMQAAQPALQETPTRPTASAGPRPAPAAPVRPSAPSAESPFTSKEFAQELQKLADDLFAGEPELATQADDMSQEVALATPPQQRDRIDVAVEDVIEEFRKGVAKTISSKDFETHYNLGIAYKEMGLVDAAIEEFRVVLNFPEMVVESCDHLGLCYIDKGELDKAVRILDFGVRMARHDPERRRGLRYDLAKALRIQGDSARALELLREVYQEDPGFADVAAQIKDLQNQIG